MAMNLVQFQPDLWMVEFMQQYCTEAKCYQSRRPRRPSRRKMGTSMGINIVLWLSKTFVFKALVYPAGPVLGPVLARQ